MVRNADRSFATLRMTIVYLPLTIVMLRYEASISTSAWFTYRMVRNADISFATLRMTIVYLPLTIVMLRYEASILQAPGLPITW